MASKPDEPHAINDRSTPVQFRGVFCANPFNTASTSTVRALGVISAQRATAFENFVHILRSARIHYAKIGRAYAINPPSMMYSIFVYTVRRRSFAARRTTSDLWTYVTGFDNTMAA